ncbi:MAG: THAP domain-containing protein, partial [Planctomycetes bacterium]|nr:THAP domain-containing protein [Planctomycetota bacterium]
MNTESQHVSSSLQRLLAATGLLCFLYALSYWLVGRGSLSIYNPGRNLFNTVFTPVALGPVFLLWQSIRYRRLEPAVILLNGLSFFHFPLSDKDRCKKWEAAVRRHNW